MPTTSPKAKKTTTTRSKGVQTTITPKDPDALDFNYKTVEYDHEITSEVEIGDIGNGVRPISDERFHQDLERVRQQVNAIKLDQERWKLQREMYKKEGFRVEAETEKISTLTKVELWNNAQVRLAQAKTQGAIESTKLQMQQADLTGNRQELGMKRSAWQMKLEGLQTDLNMAQQVLAQKKAAILGTVAQ